VGKRKSTKKKRQAGRQPKLREALDREAYLAALRSCGTQRAAAAKMGVHERTVARERAASPEFAEQLKQANRDVRGTVEQAMLGAAIDRKEPWAIKFYLTRSPHCRRAWVEYKPEAVTLKDLVRIFVQLGFELSAMLPVEHHPTVREILDRIFDAYLTGGGRPHAS